jgi:hypothetical protein
MSNRRAKRGLVGPYSKKKGLRQRKVVRTTLGELITAVTDELTPIIDSPSRLYTAVSWTLNDLFARNQIRSARRWKTGKLSLLRVA